VYESILKKYKSFKNIDLKIIFYLSVLSQFLILELFLKPNFNIFLKRLFSISTSLVPPAIKAYEVLNVKHEQLKLITPQFETPLPPLQAAVFPPSFR